MKQQVPVWVLGLLVASLIAVAAVPPWNHKPYSSKGGARTEFKGWKAWWTPTPPIQSGDMAGQREEWTVNVPYLVYEILGVCVAVLGIGALFGRKAPETAAVATDQGPPE